MAWNGSGGKINDDKELTKPVEKPVEVKPVEGKEPGKRHLDAQGRLLITDEGLDLLTHFEGFHDKAYVDPVGVITIGWGTIKYPDGRKVKIGETCTREQAREWMFVDIWDDGAKYVRLFTVDAVENALTDRQFSALTSLTFNRGAGRFRDFISPYLNKGDMGGTLLAIKSLNWAIKDGQKTYLLGLDRRRWAEAYMFQGRDWREFDTVAKFQAFKNRGYK